ncbi:GNAT family N-acetyltransferase [Paenibacillus sp. JDR-2]|uniref:GNAT family N-acetyltransferase n=1 Tax=Paenibacillus sp. (strain JDR-2) TaxID=324057 RepID=UPI000166B23E|nr:GNAT family N-acetyltransferase [Paenibacillus sp. JDR-2]ACS99399.1 GCN5-related N-acetyltransferase [Paenibacillus sp. JDR-2]
MPVEFRIGAPVTAVQVAEVFRSSGIKRPVDDLARIQKMIDNADLILSAWDGEELVGIARAVTDFSYCCYLSDLAVSKTHQRLGIGTELVNRLREHIGEEVALLLLSAPSAMDYYPQIGFNKAENAFLIKRVR